jgi:hypothetical protein
MGCGGSMDDGTSWRSAIAATGYASLDHADFAQEFLRRNRDYRQDYKHTQNRLTANPSLTPQEQEGLARRWGLIFPD